MSRFLKPAFSLCLILLLPVQLWAVVIQTKAGETIRGTIISEDAFRVKVRLEGSDQQVVVGKNEIQKLTRAVEPDQLAKLDPKDAGGYLSLANQLALNAQDPEAREVAMRLYVIAAYLEPKKFGYECLKRMSLFAPTPDQARKYKAMAFLLDDLRDPDTLTAPQEIEKGKKQAFEDFVESLRLLRRGQTKQALAEVQKKGVAEFFKAFPGVLSHDEFVEMCKKHPECPSCRTGRKFCSACKGKGAPNCVKCNGLGWYFCEVCKGHPRHVPLTSQQRALILRLELDYALNPEASLANLSKKDDRDWDALLGGGNVQAVPVLSLSSISGYDPRLSVFRDGQWVAPKE